MNTKSKWVHVLLALAGLAACAGAAAQAAAPAAAASAASAAATASPVAGQGSEYTAKGADTCLGCHDDESATYSAAAIFKGKHAHRGDKRAPFGAGGLQCEACHGPGAAHARNKKATSINSLKADSHTAEERNQPCLGCHQSSTRIGWHAGAHERGGAERIRDEIWRNITSDQMLEVAHMAELNGLPVASLTKGPIKQDSIDDSQLGRQRGAEGHAHRPAPLDDVGLLDHRLDQAVTCGVDGSGAYVPIDAGLIGAVGLERAMPIEVIAVDVETYGRRG